MISEQDHSDTFEPGDGGSISASGNGNGVTRTDSEQRSQQISRPTEHTSRQHDRKRKERPDAEEVSEGQQLQRTAQVNLEENLKGQTPTDSGDKLLWYIDHVQNQRSEAERLKADAEATLLHWKAKYARVEAELNAKRAQMNLFFAMAAEAAPQLLNLVNSQLLERSSLPTHVPSTTSLASTSLSSRMHPALSSSAKVPAPAPGPSLPSNGSAPTYNPRANSQPAWVPSASLDGGPQGLAASQPVPPSLGQPTLQPRLPIRSQTSVPPPSLTFITTGMIKAPGARMLPLLQPGVSTHPNVASEHVPIHPRPLTPRPNLSLPIQQKHQFPAPTALKATLSRPKPSHPSHPDTSAFRVVRSSHSQNEQLSGPLQREAPSAAVIFEMAKKQALARGAR